MRPLPYFRGKYRLLNALVPSHGVRTARVFGYRMELDLADTIQRQLYGGWYEWREMQYVRTVVGPGSVCVDIGANVGAYTALFSRLVGPTGRVLAFEPSQYAYKRVQAISEHTENVTVWPWALGNQSGLLPIYVPPASHGDHDPSVIQYCEGMTEVTVPVRRLDEILTESGVSQVDYLKIDVEGFEPEVFAGCEAWLQAGKIRRVQCELNARLLPMRGWTPKKLTDYLTSLGFRLIHQAGKPPSGFFVWDS